MRPLTQEELSTFYFHLLPGFDYAEVLAFEVNGTPFKVILSSPVSGSGFSVPSYFVIVQLQAWCLCPWLSSEVLDEVKKLPRPEESAARLKELLGAG